MNRPNIQRQRPSPMDPNSQHKRSRAGSVVDRFQRASLSSHTVVGTLINATIAHWLLKPRAKSYAVGVVKTRLASTSSSVGLEAEAVSSRPKTPHFSVTSLLGSRRWDSVGWSSMKRARMSGYPRRTSHVTRTLRCKLPCPITRFINRDIYVA